MALGQSARQIFAGLFLVFGIVISNVTTQQLGRSIFGPEFQFRAPFFLTAFTTSFLIFLHPILYTVLNISEILEKKSLAFDGFAIEREFLKSSKVLRVVLLFCALYIGTNTLFISSLRFISNTQAATYLATDPAFCFCLAFCCLSATCGKDYLVKNLGLVQKYGTCL